MEKRELTVEERVKKEAGRLRRVFRELEAGRKKATEGLIQRAAFMRVSLEDLEEDLRENGFTEEFSQGDQEPYDRERPAARIYNSMNTSYQKIIKQLADLLPKEAAKPKVGDDFEEF